MIVKITDTIKKDLSDIMRKELEKNGFKTTGITDVDIPFKYFTVDMRLIEKKPREIFKSEGFVCPVELQNGLALLEQKIRLGYTLFPNQSKSLVRLSSEDALFYTWSIHHFHLGVNIGSDGFIKRTGPVLFAVVTDAAFYMIDIKPHGAWSDKDLLQKIYDNWPNLIASWKVDGQPKVNLNSNEVDKFRKNNANTIVQLNDGSSFSGPGLGLTTAGIPCEATNAVICINQHIANFLRGLKNDPTDFLSTKYKKDEIDTMTTVQFDFHLYENGCNQIVVIDKTHGIWQILFDRHNYLCDKL